MTCGSSGRQAACAYSLIRPPRTGFRRIRPASMSVSRAVSVTFAGGDALGDALVRPGVVVVRLVLGQDGAQVRLAEDQHAVQELATQGADEAFADRVHPRRLDSAAQDPGPGGLEYGVEGLPALLRASMTSPRRCARGRKAFSPRRQRLSC